MAKSFAALASHKGSSHKSKRFWITIRQQILKIDKALHEEGRYFSSQFPGIIFGEGCR